MINEEGVINVRGLGVLDGKPIIRVSMCSTNITDATIYTCNIDAYELREKLDLLIQEMEVVGTYR